MSDDRKKKRAHSNDSRDCSSSPRRKKEKKSKKSHEKKYKKHRRERSRDRESSEERSYERKKRYDDYRRDRTKRDRYEEDRKRRDKADTDRKSKYRRRHSRSLTPEQKKIESADCKKNDQRYDKDSTAAEKLECPSGSSLTALSNITASTSSAAKAPPTLPAYYNPSIINATKFAEQQQKRKLLWSGKDKTRVWTGTAFSQDSDGSKANKFFRLMGIKEAPKPESTEPVKNTELISSELEHQYEVARHITHLSRGTGLGFK